MLDAYIIDRIRREREQRQRRNSQVPLYIEQPREERGERRQEPHSDDDKSDRGSVVIDFRL